MGRTGQQDAIVFGPNQFLVLPEPGLDLAATWTVDTYFQAPLNQQTSDGWWTLTRGHEAFGADHQVFFDEEQAKKMNEKERKTQGARTKRAWERNIILWFVLGVHSVALFMNTPLPSFNFRSLLRPTQACWAATTTVAWASPALGYVNVVCNEPNL